MPETAQHLLGQLVDQRFPLRKLISASSNSAVFLTELAPDRPSDPARDAAIKLIPDDAENSDQLLSRWQAAAALAHLGLLRILHFGRCHVDGSPCLYLVTELATENLAELLPQRTLTPDEASGMMSPVLSTLASLHEQGLVHGGLKPSNILAVHDKIKLSPDRILPEGEPALAWPFAAAYAPPESLLFPASDIWSLGISLYETLTQYLPNRDSSGRYVLPQLPSPFSEIIRGALVEDPTQRITLDEVHSLLDPSFVPSRKPVSEVPVPPELASPPTSSPASIAEAPPRSQSAASDSAPSPSSEPLPDVDPLGVPLSPISPNPNPPRIPVSSLPNVNVSVAAPRRVPVRKSPGSSFKFFAIGALSTLFVAALILPRLLRTPSGSSASSRELIAPTKPAVAPAIAEDKSLSSAPTPPPPRSTSPLPDAAETSPSVVASPSAKSAAPIKEDSSPKVVHKVFPAVSARARNTIRGTVRINVRLQLDPDGSVASAALDSPAPSQFFARLALDAARQWRFAPGADTSPLIHFEFTNDSTNAFVVH